jgi:hypothetical protein
MIDEKTQKENRNAEQSNPIREKKKSIITRKIIENFTSKGKGERNEPVRPEDCRNPKR